ncbi:MAG: NAD(P)-binding domain-containing protein, partial [Acidimicrobiia bacterium]|nr:NAD(P)-binding domain-containing protein [Acidimicrobiia bacterium]
MSGVSTHPSTAYNLVIVGGTAGAVSVAISSQRSGLGLVRIVEAASSLALETLVGEEQLDVGYGEPVRSIDVAGEGLVVTTAKQSYTTRAVMIAARPSVTGWAPPMPVQESDRVRVGELPDDVDECDILVVGTTDHAVEVTTELARRGGRVVLAAGGMDPTLLSPAAENMLRRLERERKATLLYRSVPDSIGLIGGFPMAFFTDRRTPDLQVDHVVFAPPRQLLDAQMVGLTDAALASGRVFFQGGPDEETDAGGDDQVEGHGVREHARQISPGWRIGLDIATRLFPELELPEPASSIDRRRRHTAAIDELRDEFYNATITRFEPTHS